MKKLSCLLSLTVLWPYALARAQLYPPNEMGVSLGQWYTLVPDLESSKKFWAVLGGKAIEIDGTTVMKFPGVLVFLRRGTQPAAALELASIMSGSVCRTSSTWLPSCRQQDTRSTA